MLPIPGRSAAADLLRDTEFAAQRMDNNVDS